MSTDAKKSAPCKFKSVRDFAVAWLERNPSQPGKPNGMRDIVVKWASAPGEPDKTDPPEVVEVARFYVEYFSSVPPLGLTRADLMRTKRAPEPAAPTTAKEALDQLLDQGVEPGQTMSWKELETTTAQMCGLKKDARGFSERNLRNHYNKLRKNRPK
jgi:hypothetical protein